VNIALGTAVHDHHSEQLPVHSGGAAVALQTYQLARRCLTTGTVHSDVTAASAVPVTFTRASKLAGHLRTVHGRGANRTSTVYTQHCDISVAGVRALACERKHNAPTDWGKQ